jgi:hypothetical protein
MPNLCVSDSRRFRGIIALNKLSHDCDYRDSCATWPTPNVAANMVEELSLPQIGSARTDGGPASAGYVGESDGLASAPIRATLPGPALAYCHVGTPFLWKS